MMLMMLMSFISAQHSIETYQFNAVTDVLTAKQTLTQGFLKECIEM